MTEESAADIVKYLDIIADEKEKPLQEGDTVHLGVATQGVEIGNRYLFDNGIRWVSVLNETDSHWLVEHGLIEHDANDEQYVDKREMASMIHNGEMILCESNYEDVLMESSEIDDGEFNDFMMGVDRYLLINYMIESQEFDYAWKIAWAEGKEPSEACEEAIILEG